MKDYVVLDILLTTKSGYIEVFFLTLLFQYQKPNLTVHPNYKFSYLIHSFFQILDKLASIVLVACVERHKYFAVNVSCETYAILVI